MRGNGLAPTERRWRETGERSLGDFHKDFHRCARAKAGSGTTKILKKLRFSKQFSEVYRKDTMAVLDSNQIVRGPRSNRAGSSKIAPSKAKTPCSVIPTMRKGMLNSQIKGYAMSASKASGQHRRKSMHQRRKAAKGTSHDLLSIRRKSGHGSSVNCKLLQFEAPNERCRHFGVEEHIRLIQFGVDDFTERVNERERAAFTERKSQR
jgi:hypothetical protein